MTTPNTIVRVKGFRFAALAAGIKKDGRADLGLAVADQSAVAAGLFTRNLVRAAPVEVAAERLRAGRARAILVNSGNANACTGEPGLAATLGTTAAVARALGIDPNEVLPASTGVIGALLPAEPIISRAAELAGALSSEYQAFAEAICTTDRWPKIGHALVGSSGAALLGIAKGAGMIHPDLAPHEKHATLLVFLFTDAIVEQPVLERSLIDAVDTTFNACSVDGDTSTNDSVFALASGASGCRVQPEELATALRSVCDRLARSVVADGEGSTQLVEIRVRGLATREQARVAAKTVATSLLSKTALFGRDPNWGRLLAAAGRSGVSFDPALSRISIGGITLVERGVTLGAEAEKRAAAAMKGESYVIELELGSGPGEFSYLGCDLGHGYVDVNAGYRS